MPNKKRGNTGVSPEEEYEIWGLIAELFKALSEARARELRPYGLSPMQVALIYVVKRLTRSTGEPPTASELSRWLVRRPPTVSAMLDRMERDGLLFRQRDEGASRETRVVLTEKGNQAFRQQARATRMIPRILECLSQEERGQLKAMLSVLRTRARQELASKPLFP